MERPLACIVSVAVVSVSLTVSACLPPKHSSVAAPDNAPAAAPKDTKPKVAPAVKIAVFDSVGTGVWSTGGAANTLKLEPAPASVVAACLEPGTSGWVAVAFDSKGQEASTTEIVEASSVPDATRTCIAKALTGVHVTNADAMRLVVYVTFSPEPASPLR